MRGGTKTTATHVTLSTINHILPKLSSLHESKFRPDTERFTCKSFKKKQKQLIWGEVASTTHSTFVLTIHR